MQSVSSRIWTCVTVSISSDDNHYTTGTSILLYYYKYNVIVYKGYSINKVNFALVNDITLSELFNVKVLLVEQQRYYLTYSEERE